MNEWITAYASVMGRSHEVTSQPCQDYCTVEVHEDYVVSIVCDGAGSCEHAQHGARFVAEFCVLYFIKHIEAIREIRLDGDDFQQAWRDIALKVLRATRDDLEKFGQDKDYEFKSLSCTVIAVVAFADRLFVTHIGDGRAGYLLLNQDWRSMIDPFSGEEANVTVFITSDIWSSSQGEQLIATNVISGPLQAYCLLTDGAESAAFECNLYDEEKDKYYDPNRPYGKFLDPNVSALQKMGSDNKTQEEINELWSAFLDSGNEVLREEPDDKTIVLVTTQRKDIN